MNIEEYLQSLPVSAYDEIVERLAEAVTGLDPDEEPSDEALATIEKRLEEESLREARSIARKVRNWWKNTDPYLPVPASVAGRHRVYRREKLSDGTVRCSVIELIPFDDGTELGSFRERPITVLFLEEQGWRCCCRSFVRERDCEHVRVLQCWQIAPSPPPADEQPHTGLCDCGAPVWVRGVCEVCHARLEDQWSSELWHSQREMVLCPTCGAKVKAWEVTRGECSCCRRRTSSETLIYRREGDVVKCLISYNLNGSYQEKPFGMVVRQGNSWRCSCSEYVSTGHCDHVDSVARWLDGGDDQDYGEGSAPLNVGTVPTPEGAARG